MQLLANEPKVDFTQHLPSKVIDRDTHDKIMKAGQKYLEFVIEEEEESNIMLAHILKNFGQTIGIGNLTVSQEHAAHLPISENIDRPSLARISLSFSSYTSFAK